jgi:hypothetical protein
MSEVLKQYLQQQRAIRGFNPLSPALPMAPWRLWQLSSVQGRYKTPNWTWLWLAKLVHVLSVSSSLLHLPWILNIFRWYHLFKFCNSIVPSFWSIWIPDFNCIFECWHKVTNKLKRREYNKSLALWIVWLKTRRKRRDHKVHKEENEADASFWGILPSVWVLNF